MASYTTRILLRPQSRCFHTLLRPHASPTSTIWHKAPRLHVGFTPRAQQRTASTRAFLAGQWRGFKQLPRQKPISFTLVMVALLTILYKAYKQVQYQKTFTTTFSPYSNRTTDRLRMAKSAVYADPTSSAAVNAAVTYYEQALTFALLDGHHKLSDEIFGIWVLHAELFEDAQMPGMAIAILQSRREEIDEWMAEFHQNGGDDGKRGERTRLLKWNIRFAHKIGGLYSSRYAPDKRMSERYLRWGVETSMKEMERRRVEGVKPGEGEFMDADQMGAQLEALAHTYEESNNHYYASQLFLRALSIKPTIDCHTILLMNNLAASLAQQIPLPDSPPSTSTSPTITSSSTPPPSRAELRNSARQWLRKALDLSTTIKNPVRNAECDIGCAVAVHNLGEFAEMDGDLVEARERYEEARSRAHAVGFEEGVGSAEEGLRRLRGEKGEDGRQMGGTRKRGWW